MVTGHPHYEGSGFKSLPSQYFPPPALVVSLKYDAGNPTRSSSELLHEAFLVSRSAEDKEIS
jgi:hypothetical protein